MSLAALSIVSSTVVAVLTVVGNVFVNAHRSSHERRAQFEERAWAAKSAAHLETIDIALALQELRGNDGTAELLIEDLANDLSGQAAALSAFASDACRKDFDAVLRHVQGVVASFDERLRREAWSARSRRKSKQVSGDATEWLGLWSREEEAKQALADAAEWDRRLVCDMARRLADSTRRSLRGE